MKNVSIYLGITIFLIFGLYFLVSNKQAFLVEQAVRTRAYKDSIRNNLFESYYMAISLSNGSKIDRNLLMTSNWGQTTPLSEVLIATKSLIFYYPKISCNSCFETELGLMRANFSGNIWKNITLVTDEDDFEKLLMIKNSFGLINEIFSMKNQKFGLPADFLDIPYLFVLDSSFTAKHLFIPIKGHESLSVEYYNRLSRIM
jgi:hypothetical protein